MSRKVDLTDPDNTEWTESDFARAKNTYCCASQGVHGMFCSDRNYHSQGVAIPILGDARGTKSIP